jgi:hypothetical protein
MCDTHARAARAPPHNRSTPLRFSHRVPALSTASLQIDVLTSVACARLVFSTDYLDERTAHGKRLKMRCGSTGGASSVHSTGRPPPSQCSDHRFAATAAKSAAAQDLDAPRLFTRLGPLQRQELGPTGLPSWIGSDSAAQPPLGRSGNRRPSGRGGWCREFDTARTFSEEPGSSSRPSVRQGH